MEIQWSLMSAERESACAREGRHSSLSTSFICVIRLTCVMRALSVQAFVPVRASARVTGLACKAIISKGKGTCQILIFRFPGLRAAVGSPKVRAGCKSAAHPGPAGRRCEPARPQR